MWLRDWIVEKLSKSPKDVRVVFLAGPDSASMALSNCLLEKTNLVGVLIEEQPSKLRMLRRRVSRLGLWVVLGQVIFIAMTKLVAKLSSARLKAAYESYGFRVDGFPEELTRYVSSANSTEVQSLLRELEPDVVVINGTRILSKATLDCVSVPFLNIHAGITPRYRGVHGGYWALALGDAENCGATVHFVDQGIDTGDVISQVRIKPAPDDDFLIYPIRQLGEATPLLLEAVRGVGHGRISTHRGVGPSQLFYHPTIWFYLRTFLEKRVR